jgi:hypothetical protein
MRPPADPLRRLADMHHGQLCGWPVPACPTGRQLHRDRRETPPGCVTLSGNALTIDCFGNHNQYTVEGVWTEVAEGRFVATGGTTGLVTPLGNIPMKTIADYLLVEDTPFSLSGTLNTIPLPAVDFLSGGLFNNTSGFEVTAGFGLGSTLHDLDAPLNDDRACFYVRVSAGVSLEFEGLNMSPESTADLVTFVIDPSDPLGYFSMNAAGLASVSVVGAASFGLSAGGNLQMKCSHEIWSGEAIGYETKTGLGTTWAGWRLA